MPSKSTSCNTQTNSEDYSVHSRYHSFRPFNARMVSPRAFPAVLHMPFFLRVERLELEREYAMHP